MAIILTLTLLPILTGKPRKREVLYSPLLQLCLEIKLLYFINTSRIMKHAFLGK